MVAAHLVKKHFIDISIEINQFHIQQLKDEPSWTIAKTASALNRSIGSISQYITLASWVKTHEKQLRRCRSLRDALQFIKDKEREMRFS